MRLVVENLHHSFSRKRADALPILAVDRLEVERGQFLAVTGPSGSGKTTLLYALSGLIVPQSGAVAWGGTDIAALGEGARDHWRRNNSGFIFQNFHLIAEMTPLQNVAVAAYFSNWSARPLQDRAAALLDRLDVPNTKRPVETLSRGEQQRVALARAILRDPAILFADEPTASLDAGNGQAIAGQLQALARERKMTVIAVSHDSDVMALADRTIRLEHGRLTEDNPGVAA